MDRAVILGASRGLGAELVAQATGHAYSVTGFARKVEGLMELQERHPLFEYVVADLASRTGQDEVIRYCLEADLAKVFCVAAGGPYGLFHEREWKDHAWAWEVTFVAHARLLHALAVAGRRPQVILIGSSVAESRGDPRASSYAAAKHALKGLWSSLRGEYPDWDLRLFSPGYMDTALLPRHAPVRRLGVHDPGALARDLWLWSLTADIGGHKLYPSHPT